LYRQTHGSGMVHITKGRFDSTAVSLPPEREQRRIVDEIEKQFTRLDAAVEALRRVQANLKRYRASVLKAACEGRLVPTEAALARAEGRGFESADVLLQRILKERRRKWEEDQLAKFEAKGKLPKDDAWKKKYQEPTAPDVSELPELPEGWCWASVEQLQLSLRNGISKKPDGDTGLSILRISSVRSMSVDLDDRRYLTDDLEAYSDFAIEEGDLLFTRYNGSPELVGVCGVVPALPEPFVYPDKLIRVRVPSSLSPPSFLQIVFSTGASRDFIRSRTRTTAGQAGISGGDLKQAPVPIAPLLEQMRISLEVESKLSVVEKTMGVIAELETRAERLRQAILKRAFEGRLVPQDPDDEPASVLLERIGSEREARAGAGKKRKTVKKAAKRKTAAKRGRG
ncbi:MAG: hypothetical protein KDH09_12315, partial [Chrysiogenetes bacterium]|nr:hypothetical protein [Chrysiogenetes bacterium]